MCFPSTKTRSFSFYGPIAMQVHLQFSVELYLSSVQGTLAASVDRAQELAIDLKGLMDFYGVISG